MRRTWAAAARGVALVAIVGSVAGCLPGTPDRGFGAGGTVVLDGVTGAVTTAAAPGGGVVVSASRHDRLRLVTEDGVLDPAWGEPLPVPCLGRGEVVRDRRDRFVVACAGPGGAGGTAVDLVRVTAAGRVDRTFGTDGVARLPAPAPAAVVPAGPGYVGVRLEAPAEAVPALAVTVLREDGTVARESTVPLGGEPLPPGGRAPAVVVEPARDGALVTVAPALSLAPDGDPGSVLRLDRRGRVDLRLDGPWPGAPGPYTGLHGAVELPDGRIAVTTASTSSPAGERPEAVHHVVDVYGRRGRHQRSIPLVVQPPGAPFRESLQLRTLVGTGGGRWLWAAGSVSPIACAPGGSCEVVARYDTATGAPDPAFGRGAAVPVDHVVDDMDARLGGPPQVYLAGSDGTVSVTRLWDTAPRPG